MRGQCSGNRACFLPTFRPILGEDPSQSARGYTPQPRERIGNSRAVEKGISACFASKNDQTSRCCSHGEFVHNEGHLLDYILCKHVADVVLYAANQEVGLLTVNGAIGICLPKLFLNI